ncbi:glycosyltransferase family 2 protein [Shewanella sp. NIFS-20-20]|uniref:glycosyltransferase family 2 protein n=1 Tax=Shewanella sp. NIFS-20-20 TaxID=2853806 RepID=UPI001C493F76|nr:glycosyltransferase family 2 protein [Shewanella sp. NIFS-20-20]
MISVVLPAKNEAENLPSLINEIATTLASRDNFEIIVVDDGSSDNTFEASIQAAELVGADITMIRHRFSAGQSTALSTGIQHAKGELIVTLDADGQNDPADIPALVAMAKSADTPHFCVAGFRKKRKDTAWVRFQSRIANNIRNSLLNDGVPDTGCGLKLFPRDTFLQLPYFDHMHRYLPALIKRLGGNIYIVEVNHRDRQAGTSNYNAWNRAWVGISDMLGVMWLQKRSRIIQIEKTEQHKAK